MTDIISYARDGNLRGVRTLVENGQDVNYRNQNRETALTVASQNGHLPVVRYLVDNGADINLVGKIGWTPLGIASYYGKTDVVRYLVNNGADVDYIDRHRNTALTLASEDGHLAIIKMLVEHGADVDHVNLDGMSALQTAIYNRHYNVVNYLRSVVSDQPKIEELSIVHQVDAVKRWINYCLQESDLSTKDMKLLKSIPAFLGITIPSNATKDQICQKIQTFLAEYGAYLQSEENDPILYCKEEEDAATLEPFTRERQDEIYIFSLNPDGRPTSDGKYQCMYEEGIDGQIEIGRTLRYYHTELKDIKTKNGLPILKDYVIRKSMR